MLGWLVTRPLRVLRAATAFVVVIGTLCGAHAVDGATGGTTLDTVQHRGFLRCGVHRSGLGLAEVNADGHWSGYFVEYCRIVAAATVGDTEAVRFIEVDDISATLALTENLADVVISTLDPGGAAAPGGDRIDYLMPILEDRLILVPARGTIRRIADLPHGTRICSGGHAAYQDSLRRAIGNRVSFVEVVSYESIDGLFNAFFRQRCDAISHHSFAIRSQGALRAPSRVRLDLAGLDLGRVEFRPSVGAADPAWGDLVGRILGAALFDPAAGGGGRGALTAGQIQRIRAIASAPEAVFARTLGHDGGQGFEPTLPATGI